MRRFALALVMAAAAARADDFPATHQYPPGTIDSVEKADAALAAAREERAGNLSRFEAGRAECLHKFFTNSCIDSLKTQRRAEDAAVEEIELEAKRFKRQAEADKEAADRAQSDEKKAANASADALERAHNRAVFEQRQSDAARTASDRAAKAAAAPANASAYAAKQTAAAQKAASDAQQRSQTESRHDKAEADQAEREESAQARRERLARKRAENEADRAHRAAEAAAKNATLAPPLPAQGSEPPELAK